MNHRGQILRSSRRPLWECILDRHKYRGRWLRPRVPLVFRRISSPENFYQRPRLLRPVVQYPLNLHLQLSWPLVSVEKTRLRDTIRQSRIIRTHLERTSEKVGKLRNPGNLGNIGNPGQTTPASVQWSSLIKSYAIVNTQRHHLHATSNVFKSAGRVPLPLSPAASDHNPRFSTHVELNHTAVKVEPGRTSDRTEDPARRAFPQVVITSRRRLIAERDILTSRPLLTASAPRIVRHQTETANQSPTIRRHETLTHAEVFHPSRVHPDTASTPLPASVTTRYSSTVKTETTRGSFVPPQQRLYWQRAARDFVTVPAHVEEKHSAPEEPRSVPQRASVPQPTLDITQLSEEVYRHIQRKLRIERERRGL